jgi:anti-sigma regulatory factor (Ser/Thr protein kinase)
VEVLAMTEAEWIACDDPSAMLNFLNVNPSNQRVRLYAVACCTRTRFLSKSNRSHPAAANVPLHADLVTIAADLGETRGVQVQIEEALVACRFTEHDLFSIRLELEEALVDVLKHGNLLDPEERLLVYYRVTPSGFEAEVGHFGRQPAERGIQAALLRDIFGNPFRPVTFEPAWRTTTAVQLAQSMYHSRDFAAMSILADALQDAGCDNAAILDHCRGEGPHVRGCWVVDLVLGKE